MSGNSEKSPIQFCSAQGDIFSFICPNTKDFQIGLKNKKTILKIVKVFFFLCYMHIFPFSQQARRDVILFP